MRRDLVLFIEALILARQWPDLIPEIARTVDRLHVEAARAYAGEMARHGWHTRIPRCRCPQVPDDRAPNSTRGLCHGSERDGDEENEKAKKTSRSRTAKRTGKTAARKKRRAPSK